MDYLVKYYSYWDSVHTVPHRALDCRPGIDGLNQVYGPNHPTRSVLSICGKYVNIFTRRTIRNHHAILKTAVRICNLVHIIGYPIIARPYLSNRLQVIFPLKEYYFIFTWQIIMLSFLAWWTVSTILFKTYYNVKYLLKDYN